MSCAIVQYNIDPQLYAEPGYNNLHDTSLRRSFEKKCTKLVAHYCKKHNIDHHVITKPILGHRHPTFERFDLWLNPQWTDKYEYVLYMDNDIMIDPESPNIFNWCRNDSFNVCWYKFRHIQPDVLKKQVKDHVLKHIPSDTLRYRFQSGLFILNKHSVNATKRWISKYKMFNVDDGMILNWAILASKVKMNMMPITFNVKFNTPTKTGYFLHAAGGKKHAPNNFIHWRCDAFLDKIK